MGVIKVPLSFTTNKTGEIYPLLLLSDSFKRRYVASHWLLSLCTSLGGCSQSSVLLLVGVFRVEVRPHRAAPHTAALPEGTRADQVQGGWLSWLTDVYTGWLRRTSLSNFSNSHPTLKHVDISTLTCHSHVSSDVPAFQSVVEAFSVADSGLWNTAAERHVGAVTDFLGNI